MHQFSSISGHLSGKVNLILKFRFGFSFMIWWWCWDLSLNFFPGHEAKRTWKRLALSFGSILVWSCSVSCHFIVSVMQIVKQFRWNLEYPTSQFYPASKAKPILICCHSFFPRLAAAACIRFASWLAHLTICVCYYFYFSSCDSLEFSRA